MAVRKIAISVKQDVLRHVDDAAKERGMTRSGFITLVLTRTAGCKNDEQIRRRINQIFADPKVVEEQRKMARAASASLARVVAKQPREKW